MHGATTTATTNHLNTSLLENKVVFYISKDNKDVLKIIDFINKNDIKSRSHAICNLIREGFKMLGADDKPQTDINNPITTTRTRESGDNKSSNDIKRTSFIKRFLSKNKTIPALHEYHVKRIGGLSVSQAYRRGKITQQQALDIWLGTALIYSDMMRDSRLAPLASFHTKRDTHSNNKIGWVYNKIKDTFEKEIHYTTSSKTNLPKDNFDDIYEEIN